MTTKASLIALSEAVPGMILAANVCDAGGASLLSAGAELSQGMIASLQRRGVAHIQVAEEQEALTPEQQAARQAEVAARVDVMFRYCGSDPLMAKLREVLLAYRLEALE